MKPRFTDAPLLWTRASRTYTTPADYASAIQSFQRKGHSAVVWVGVVILAGFAAAYLAGVL